MVFPENNEAISGCITSICRLIQTFCFLIKSYKNTLKLIKHIWWVSSELWLDEESGFHKKPFQMLGANHWSPVQYDRKSWILPPSPISCGKSRFHWLRPLKWLWENCICCLYSWTRLKHIMDYRWTIRPSGEIQREQDGLITSPRGS